MPRLTEQAKARALESFERSPSYVEAARAAGVHRDTIRLWRLEPGVQELFDAAEYRWRERIAMKAMSVVEQHVDDLRERRTEKTQAVAGRLPSGKPVIATLEVPIKPIPVFIDRALHAHDKTKPAPKGGDAAQQGSKELVEAVREAARGSDEPQKPQEGPG